MAGNGRLGRSAAAAAVRGLRESGVRPRRAKAAAFEQSHGKGRLSLTHCRQLSCYTNLPSGVLQAGPSGSSVKQQTRHFLNLAASLLGAKRVEYEEVRQLPYSVDQMYNIVEDVDSYHLFVPWCTCSRVISRCNQFSQAELEVGFPPVVERYVSEIFVVPRHQIRVMSKDGRLFQHLETLWQFQPGRSGKRETCTLKFYVSFEFKSVLHTQLANLFFNEVVKQMVSAFEQRAEKLYGSPATAQSRKAIQCT